MLLPNSFKISSVAGILSVLDKIPIDLFNSYA